MLVKEGVKANHLTILGVKAMREDVVNIVQSFRIMCIFKWRRDLNLFSKNERNQYRKLR